VGTHAYLIVAWLKTRAEYSWQRDQIAAGTGLMEATVGTILRRMVRRKEPEVACVSRGFYQHPSGFIKRGVDFDPRIRFHGLKFESRCYIQAGWPYRRMADYVTSRLPHPAMKQTRRKDGHPNFIVTYADWTGRGLTITLHNDPTVLLELFVHSTTYPLDIHELYAFLDGWIPGTFPNIPLSSWLTRQTGMNIDERVPRLVDAGFEGLTLQETKDFILRYYQKIAEIVRTDFHDNTASPMDRLLANARAILEARQVVREVRP
jgi:hypothetical protein